MRRLELPDSLRSFTSEQSPLWPLTTMRVGGPARWLVQPKSEQHLLLALAWIELHGLDYMVLGGGANVIFPSEGFPGAIVSVRKLKGIRFDETGVTAACGESLSALASQANRVGLAGMEWACGIPGTVGGAIVMNAGTSQGDMASILSSVRMITAEGECSLSARDLELGYRTSALRTGALQGIVFVATFELQRDDPVQCVRREREILRSRAQTLPIGASSGCIFRNPAEGSPAGLLLDQAGCKGLRVGSAVVSMQHANFILNEGENNSDDVLELIRLMRQRVIDTHGIVLDTEVVLPR
ncbi:MAG: UDP-N-acetylmuramate dehydrogenase [Candidatus Atribacteria bacterium]|nr:MAG: UDP-N-acetylmuramate dehydrogenase [Candidatus Atribacteria bacterium]